MRKYVLFIFLLSGLSWAKKTTYLSFDEPPGWSCDLAQGVYICQATKEPERSESLILVFGAPSSEWDSYENYENYLKKSKTILDEAGKPVSSKVVYVRKRNINGFDWIDSLQENSELSGFWTRYLATVQKPLAILVTYVVSNQKYQDLTPAFERMVASLKPVNDFKFSDPNSDLVSSGTELGGVLKSQIEKRLKKPAIAKSVEPEPPSKTPLLLVLLMILIGGLLVLRLRKKKN